MNNFIYKWLTGFFIILVSSYTLQAISIQERQVQVNLCKENGVVFGFFNGVNTSHKEAEKALGKLIKTFGERTSDGEKIKYELFYNYTNGFEDFVETFEQRLKEQGAILENRFELFFQVLHKKGSWWEKMVASSPEVASILGAMIDEFQALAINALTTELANPNTTEVYTEHKIRIDNFIIEGNKLLFFAHSQGNLFATSAYDYALTKTSESAVKVVHVAPASPTLRGSHTLANVDLVINGLRLVGSVPSITDTMPGYLQRPPGVNGKTDFLGHGLLEIYLNPSLPMLSRIRSHVTAAFTSLVAPNAQASPGFFTVTLTWDGTGDVDLHTFEPDGSHVYYRSKTGTAGYLDVDNTSANGPEHYYASCEQDKLLEGTYSIQLANYARAQGRVATVQVASWKEGVLSTKYIPMGAVTGNTPAYTVFNVKIDKNSNDEYSVSLDHNIP